MKIQLEIEDILKTHFSPTYLIVTNFSNEHAGHLETQEFNHRETHFKIEIKSEKFKDKTSIEIHRMIYFALDSIIKSKIHAIEIDIK